MMLSRVAERLYWFARYVERTENTARLLLVRHHMVLDLPAKVQPGWNHLIEVLGANEEFRHVPGKASEKNVVSFVFGNRDHSGSIYSSLRKARENLRTTREVMPTEVWERINSLYLSVARRGNQDLPRSMRHRVLNDIIQRCQQITGMLAGTMIHEDAYQFIRIGRNLERADMGSRIIDVGSAYLLGSDEENQPFRGTLWVGVLKSLSAYQMYRMTVRRNVNAEDVLAFLLLSPTFPRALAHSLEVVESSIQKLPCHDNPLAVISEVHKELQQADLERLQGAALHAFIDEVQLRIDRVHEAIYHSWFAPELAV
jgi:uncharacterized alpha-E superfamily protein